MTRATAKKASKKAPPPQKPQPPKRRRHDWEAIERDYRTGQFTLKELEAKHGAGFADISRRAKKEGWTKDLRDAVRQATSAALIAETAKAVTSQAQRETTNVVLAAAEVNRQVLAQHLGELEETRNVAKALLAEIGFQTASPEVLVQIAERLNDDADDAQKQAARKALRDALNVHGRIASAQKLADTFLKIQQGERRALNLDEPSEKPKDPPPSLADVPPGSEVDAYRAWVNG